MTHYIYVLKCPVSDAVRYVGKCRNLKSRLRQHISESKKGLVRSHKCSWIRSLLRRGLRPKLGVDIIIPKTSCWKVLERERVSYYLAQGFKLTNGTIGGDGDGPLTEDGRRILSEKASAQFGTLDGRIRQSESMKALCADKEFVQKRNAAAKATRATKEYKASASRRIKEQWAAPGYKEKMILVRAALNSDPAFRKKISAGVTKAQSSPEVRARIAERARAAWANPAVRARQISAIRSAKRMARDGKDADPQAMARAIDAALAKLPPSKFQPPAKT